MSLIYLSPTSVYAVDICFRVNHSAFRRGYFFPATAFSTSDPNSRKRPLLCGTRYLAMIARFRIAKPRVV